MLSTTEAARILGIDSSQIRRIIKQGKLKATQVGLRTLVINEADLEAYRRTPQGKMGRPRKGVNKE